jgi:hypothetical protein
MADTPVSQKLSVVVRNASHRIKNTSKRPDCLSTDELVTALGGKKQGLKHNPSVPPWPRPRFNPEPQPGPDGEIPLSRFAQRLRRNTGQNKGLSSEAKALAQEVIRETDDPTLPPEGYLYQPKKQKLTNKRVLRRGENPRMRENDCGNDDFQFPLTPKGLY